MPVSSNQYLINDTRMKGGFRETQEEVKNDLLFV